ncbi:MAG: hypothetical protein Q7T63_02390, partial [Burkholderiaceae bacterium]|nr:hypothetical protein [Burkholderiaceae bacterium]
MPRNWMRRAVLALACASATLLVACGEGTIESALVPSRYIAFGDGFSDVGQAGTRYTVNDGGVTIWWEQLAAGFGAGGCGAAGGCFCGAACCCAAGCAGACWGAGRRSC